MTEKVIKTIAELDAFVKDHHSVLIDFHATWCGPCVRIAPFVHQQVHEHHVALAKVDVDEAEEVAAKYKIQSMPTFVVLTPGGEVIRKSGASDNVVRECIAVAKAHQLKK